MVNLLINYFGDVTCNPFISMVISFEESLHDYSFHLKIVFGFDMIVTNTSYVFWCSVHALHDPFVFF